MNLYNEIRSRVPEKFHNEPCFVFLADTARLGVFDSVNDLIELLDNDIKKINDWLSGNVMTGNVEEVAIQMSKLDKLKGAKQYLMEYLVENGDN
ncbi:MAG: hypothetical protein KAT77_01090 [Nanoarchaeota archaeon]|nr:hypothetical protein [Nanoarchaeota archaeon]